MVDSNHSLKNMRSIGRLFLPSLSVAYFTLQLPMIIAGIVIIEMGQTFNLPVGVIGQIQTGASILAVLTGLLMGFLSLRFPHNRLLLMGLGILGLSALGSGFAVSFLMLLIAYSLTGVTRAMVAPMASTLIGKHYPPERRTTAISWTVAGMAASWIIGSPVVSWITEMSDWRIAFLSYVLPLSIVSVLLAIKGLP